MPEKILENDDCKKISVTENISEKQSSVALMQIHLTCAVFGLSKQQTDMMVNLCIDYAQEVAREVATRAFDETWKALKSEARKENTPND